MVRHHTGGMKKRLVLTLMTLVIPALSTATASGNPCLFGC